MLMGSKKRKDLELLREKFRNKQGTREEYLAYAFLRGIPYRSVEKFTNEDRQGFNLSHTCIGYSSVPRCIKRILDLPPEQVSVFEVCDWIDGKCLPTDEVK